MNIPIENIRLDVVKNLYQPYGVSVDVLRLDLIHPVVSGNKWFKLRYYIEDAVSKKKTRIVTFGGAYSNHIIATAAAATANGLKSTGIIRGERPAQLSQTLKDAESYGMQLEFISREAYKVKELPDTVYVDPQSYFIGEGGYGIRGRKGAATILQLVNLSDYSDIVAAVGTGTMLAGLVEASGEARRVIGIPVLKNNKSISADVNELLPESKRNAFHLRQEFHFGGYARYNPELLNFMNDWYTKTAIPSDFVYTGKLFYAIDSLIREKFFPAGSRILAIHSGGLQGNRSLEPGTLIF